ncbi:type II secretion system protein [Roseimaritima ulvae]|uniref:Putative major pilin subunit n=1 Tax=Roseimaritima ulvae TaxID=980254 RepID=A0A5B9QNH7_9BACT|nr:type II secretion system protein [Roseimaritima ulvae]QEG40524.1 putative major pilin subunit [Roseimaritima ulvae]
MKRCHPKPAAGGFTLVELLVVITIIAVLAGIAIPTIGMVQRRASNASIRMEITEIEKAANNYATAYGDLPPDGSSWVVMNRHLNKAFPRISAVDRTLLYNMCHEPNVAASNSPSGSTFYPAAIDRAEAIVLFLGGLSADESRPFTGPGGPFQFVGTAGTDSPVDPDSYQYNIDRNSPRMELDITRLTLAQLPNPTAPVSTSNRVLSNDDNGPTARGDLIPVYVPNRRQAPYVYFDSRTYGYVVDSPIGDLPYNGYADTNWGAVRPYKTNLNPPGAGSFTAANVPEALRWQNPDSFQVISAGQDDHFGNLAFNPGNSNMPAYFIAETGQAIACDPSKGSASEMYINLTNGFSADLNGFQERSLNSSYENSHLDNITNFSEKLTLQDNLP